MDVSTGLVQGLMVKRRIANVNTTCVKDTYATITNDHHHGVKPELIARKWGIGLNKAKTTLKFVTQQSIRSTILPLTRRYRIDLMPQQLRGLSTTWYTDTLFAKDKSLTGNTCAQLYTGGNEFAHVYPIGSKSEAGDTLQQISKDIGIPNTIISDNSPEQTSKFSKFQTLCWQMSISLSRNWRE